MKAKLRDSSVLASLFSITLCVRHRCCARKDKGKRNVLSPQGKQNFSASETRRGSESFRATGQVFFCCCCCCSFVFRDFFCSLLPPPECNCTDSNICQSTDGRFCGELPSANNVSLCAMQRTPVRTFRERAEQALTFWGEIC